MIKIISRFIFAIFIINLILPSSVFSKKYRHKYRTKKHKKRRITRPLTNKLKTNDDMDNLTNDINNLKSKIFRAKSNLILSNINDKLKKPLIPIITINLKNKLSKFKIDSLVVSIDNEEIISHYGYTKDKQKRYNTVEGKHALYIRAVFKGNGNGIFNYLSSYSVVKEIKQDINIPQRDYYNLDITISEKNSFFNSFKNRPNISVDITKKRTKFLKKS